MDIEDLVLRYKSDECDDSGNLVAIVIKVESNKTVNEFYKKYNMLDICGCIEKAVYLKFGYTLKTFIVERTRICNGFVYVKFKYSIDGRLTDSFEDYLCKSVQDVVSHLVLK